MNPIVFSIGNFDLRWYSVFIIIGILLGYYFITREGKRFGLSDDYIFNMIFWTIILGFIGARLYYVVFNFHLFRNIQDIVKVWEGGLAIHGGIIFGIMVLIFYSKKYKVNALRILDIVSVPLLLAQAIGRWGNFFNSEAYGSATTLSHLTKLKIPKFIIDGMHIGGVYYTPTFLYESLWCLLGFIILLIIRRLRYIKVGQTMSLYLMWYSVGRFFIEILRTDSLMFYGFKVAQLTSILLFAIGLIIFIIKARKGRFEDLYNDENNIEKLRY